MMSAPAARRIAMSWTTICRLTPSVVASSVPVMGCSALAIRSRMRWRRELLIARYGRLSTRTFASAPARPLVGRVLGLDKLGRAPRLGLAECAGAQPIARGHERRDERLLQLPWCHCPPGRIGEVGDTPAERRDQATAVGVEQLCQRLRLEAQREHRVVHHDTTPANLAPADQLAQRRADHDLVRSQASEAGDRENGVWERRARVFHRGGSGPRAEPPRWKTR